MDLTSLVFGAIGAAGATIYSFPVYIRRVSKIPPMAFAMANLLFSVTVGAICAAVFTNIIGYNFPWTVEPEPWPLALVVGLGSNPLVPIMVRRLEKWAGAYEGKSQ